MTQEGFSRAFKGAPMKRAKLRGLKRNAAVVLGNVDTADDTDLVTQRLTIPSPSCASTPRRHWRGSRSAWSVDR
jgi:epoxyqueuosine reductase